MGTEAKNSKSKSGIKLITFALIGYIFCYFGYYQFLLLLLGYVVLVEKNNWLIYQLTQALILRLSYDVIRSIWNFIHQSLHKFFNYLEVKYETMSSLSSFNDTVIDLLLYAFLILLIIGIIRLLISKEVKIPFISNLTKKAVEFDPTK